MTEYLIETTSKRCDLATNTTTSCRQQSRAIPHCASNDTIKELSATPYNTQASWSLCSCPDTLQRREGHINKQSIREKARTASGSQQTNALFGYQILLYPDIVSTQQYE